MRITVSVVVQNDNDAVVSTQEASVLLPLRTVARFKAGEYPERLQLLIEAAIPRMVKDAIEEAAAPG